MKKYEDSLAMHWIDKSFNSNLDFFSKFVRDVFELGREDSNEAI
jgi:hypothetical protein